MKLPVVPSSSPRPSAPSERARLQELLLAVDAAVEQLVHAQMTAAQGGTVGRPSEDLRTIERLLGEVTHYRNALRDRVLGLLGSP